MKILLNFTVVTFATSLLVAGCATSARTGEKSGWNVLFDGKSTDAFRGFREGSFPTNSWVIDDGALKSLPQRQVDLITRERYESFELELEWKVAKEANSGIMFHVSEDEAETYITGPEMQIVDDANTEDGANPKTCAGSLYDLIAPTNRLCHPAGKWNRIRLVVQGNHVEYWMNGAKILEYELGSESLKTLIANSKFKDWPRFAREKTGYIALQNHGNSVWFRNVRVRRL
jgi:Domain of Unknown Function (DUF1080)